MKIEIQGRPEFRFQITKKAVEVLMKLSDRHYDGRCRSVSKQDGFLKGWENRLELQEEANGEVKDVIIVTAKFRELDTLLKITEYPHGCSRDELNILGSLVMSIGSALAESNRICPTWIYTVETRWEL